MAEHISEEFLRKLINNRKAIPSKAKESHLRSCQKCRQRFVALLVKAGGKRTKSV
jgi:hypothetical protein